MVQETQSPDLIVVTSNGMRQQTSYDAWGMRGIGGGMGGITPEQSVQGTMIVDLHDSKTQSLGAVSLKTRSPIKVRRTRKWLKNPFRKCSNSGQSSELLR
jgi:hypothetical protein